MMKTGVLFLLSVQANDEEKKVPPRTPENRLKKLDQFSKEWCLQNLEPIVGRQRANKWIKKFEKNSDRMKKRFNSECGFFDPTVPNGGPNPNSTIANSANRDRRSIDSNSQLRTLDDDGFGTRYDKTDPARGIAQIATGYKKWAERYIADCFSNRNNKHQPEVQENRYNHWQNRLWKALERGGDNGGSGESSVSM